MRGLFLKSWIVPGRKHASPGDCLACIAGKTTRADRWLYNERGLEGFGVVPHLPLLLSLDDSHPLPSSAYDLKSSTTSQAHLPNTLLNISHLFFDLNTLLTSPPPSLSSCRKCSRTGRACRSPSRWRNTIAIPCASTRKRTSRAHWMGISHSSPRLKIPLAILLLAGGKSPDPRNGVTRKLREAP